MFTYTKSLSQDFLGNLSLEQFRNEINSSVEIEPNCIIVKNIIPDMVEIVFDSSLNSAEESALTTIISSHVPEIIIGGALSNYDALVDLKGNGDFSKPSQAFAEGATTVFIRPGIYFETENIVIPNNGVMVGETVAPVIIYFIGSVGIKIDGSKGVKETQGNISVTNNTNLVTGNGTNFSILNPGNFILLDQNFYQIESIINDTNLTLTETYKGRTLFENKFAAQPMYTGINLANIVVTGSLTTGIYMRALRSSVVDTCALISNNTGIEMIDSSTNAFNSINCFDNQTSGISIISSHSLGFVNGEFYNNHNGVNISGNSTNIVLNGVLVANNNNFGINITGTCNTVLVNDCVIQRNNGKGIYTEENTGNTIIDGSMMIHNNLEGVDFKGNNNIVSNCNISYNQNDGIHAGDNGTITGCHIHNNLLNGCNILGNDSQIANNNIHDNKINGVEINGNRNTIQGNSIRGDSGSGIHISGKDNNITGNTIFNNSQDGIYLEDNSSENILANNRISDNIIGINISSNSHDSIINGNIITSNNSHGISISSNDCIISNNLCKNNLGDGCVILINSTNNLVKINKFTSNAGNNFTDNGTSTQTD
jgi:parallel beta-helix repeat protein